MAGHSDAKIEIAKEKMAHGEKVSNKYKVREEQRVVDGKHNVSLKKEDYQNIEEYRKQATKSGNFEFQPIEGKKTSETVKYSIPRKEGL
ncbi:MAG: hypothetical protein HQK99_08440 [Nitrospirae bacterium]|nr:hypothetical protein [Nitrospirota bacterium]